MEEQRRRSGRGIAPPINLSNAKRLRARVVVLWPIVALAGMIIGIFEPGPVSELAFGIALISSLTSIIEAFTAIVSFVTGERHAETVEREIELADRQLDLTDRQIELEKLRIQRVQIENDGDRQRARLRGLTTGADLARPSSGQSVMPREPRERSSTRREARPSSRA